MRIPTRTDWGDIDKDDLDADHAFKQFFGKTINEAEAMFQENALYFQEDLQSMPSIPFNYYAPALVSYITSSQAQGDSDGASSFLHMISWMFKIRHAIISEATKHLLINAAKKVASRQQFYDADIDIYGEFSKLYDEIEGHAKNFA